MSFFLLVCAALKELLCYEIAAATLGFPQVRRSLANLRVRRQHQEQSPEDLARILAAVNWAVMLYWKDVQCLQRSIATARLLRRHGIAGRVVIGFREIPFFCHAWVEVGREVVNDSPTYKEALHVLDNIGVPDVRRTATAVRGHSIIATTR